MTTRLADVIIPEVYQSYDAVDTPELTAFLQSGVAVRNEAINANAVEGGTTVNLPFWKDLDPTVEPNYSTDDPAVLAAANKIQASKMVARIANMNQGYSAADLVTELAGSDPMIRIRNRFGAYWNRQFQRRLLATCTGVMVDNIASNGGDMVNDISIADGANATDDNLFSRKAFTGAVFTLGDMFDMIVAIAVHSIVYKRMVDNDDIEFIKDSSGTTSIPFFMGKRVIVDDSMPVVAGGVSGYVFTSVLFGAGAIGFGEGNPRVPVEMFRIPQAGNGAGVEELWERKTWIIHPFGFKWDEGSLAGQSATLAELKLAANWSRAVPSRKNVPMAFLKTNG
jgi:hypothetical protein